MGHHGTQPDHPHVMGVRNYLLIAHNLATVRYMSYAVAIIYLGEIVGYAEGDELFRGSAPSVYQGADVGYLNGASGDGDRRDRGFRRDAAAVEPTQGMSVPSAKVRWRWTCQEVASKTLKIGPSHTVSCHLCG
jgi:peptide/nickel transport system ATP-binding protein/oligopeptide transport system ATP-binding protein